MASTSWVRVFLGACLGVALRAIRLSFSLAIAASASACNQVLGIHELHGTDDDGGAPVGVAGSDGGRKDGGGNPDGGCSESERRCRPDLKTPEECVRGAWLTLASCPMACSNGACVSCAPNATRCSESGQPQKCNAAGSAFEDQPPCPSNLPLCDSVTGTCTVGCTPGDQRCNPNAPVIQQCDLTGLWHDVSNACTYVCSGTGMSTACTGSCKPGTRSCGANNALLLCDDKGTNQPQMTCANLCVDGACGGACSPNTTRCAPSSMSTRQTCDATGQWGPAEACTYVCDSTIGDCGGECAPGSPNQCSGNSVQTCGANGQWSVTTTCAGIPCSAGQCRVCVSNEKQCNEGRPQTCIAAVWIDDQTGACPFLCDASTGKCTGACIPGTDVCSASNVSKHCGTDAMYSAGTTCPNICDPASGRCGGVCAPGSHRCNGTSAQTCGSDGQWGADTACPFGCSASTGQCNACVDEPMTTTCAGGKCGPTMNNCNNTVQCLTTCSGTGQTCGGGGVMGVCGCRPETSAQTCQNGARCGNVLNNCGQSVSCPSTCTAPQTCGGGTTPNVCGCTPKTMAVACAGKNCDGVPDGCGGTVNCGSCASPQTCGGGGAANVCGCTPVTAAAACGTRNCGTMPNGCGATVNCGSMGSACPTGQVCSNGTCASTCTPLTACPSGKNCGTLDNGCGTGTLTCGTMSGGCPSGQTCGGGAPGTANVCGCTPLSMGAACTGKNCGTVPNGCGGTISCGSSCSANQTCGGGGTQNVCGCTPVPMATACAGKNCGTVANGCGGTYTCGTCTPPQTCGGNGTSNVCGCTPLTATQACPSGQNCGSAPDSCNGMVSCGTCPQLQTCGGGGTANRCGCTPATSCPAGSNCGMFPNGCGGSITCTGTTCGTGAGQACGAVTTNQCGCSRLSTTVTCNGKCGNVADNCGTIVPCAACTAGQECRESPATPVNTCCTPETNAQMCSRLAKNCGSVTDIDNCGVSRAVNCGTCTGAGQVCGATNVCGCTPEGDPSSCTRLGAACGTFRGTDNCGSTHNITCAACPSGQGCCTANQCTSLSTTDNCAACGTRCVAPASGNGSAQCTVGAAHPCGAACRVPSTAATCSSGQPWCMEWAFESNSTEGWTVNNPAVFAGFGAAVGAGIARTEHVFQGNFAFGFDLTTHVASDLMPQPTDITGADVAVCPDGGAIQLGGKTLHFNLFLSSTQQDLPTGAVNGNGIVTDQSGQRVSTSDFSLLDAPVQNVWHPITLPLSDGGFTRVGFQIIIGEDWQGTVFIDDVQVTP